MRTNPRRSEKIQYVLRYSGLLLAVALIAGTFLQTSSLARATGQERSIGEASGPVAVDVGSPASVETLQATATRLLAPSVSAGASVQATEALTHTVYLPFVTRTTYRAPLTHLYGVQLFWQDLDLVPTIIEAGVNWVRVPLYWAYIEPTNTTPEHYQWSPSIDAKLQRLGGQNFRIMLTLERNPSWASTYLNGPIDKVGLDELAEFLGAAVARYSAPPYNVKYWEMYNEPDCGDPLYSEMGGMALFGNEPVAYAQVLATASAAIKAVDPGSQVVFGGIAYDFWTGDNGPFVKEFLDGVLQYIKQTPGSYFDVMNFHVYPNFEFRWAPYGPGLLGKARAIREKLAAYGLNKPVMCSETGWQSSAYPNGGGSDEQQAHYVVVTFARSAAADLKSAIWYKLVDDPGVDGYWKTGLVDENFIPRLAFYTYKTVVKQLGTATYLRAMAPGEFNSESAEGYFFVEAGTSANILVVWGYSDTVPKLTIPAKQLLVVDQTGNQSVRYDGDDGRVDGVVHVAISTAPVYIHLP